MRKLNHVLAYAVLFTLIAPFTAAAPRPTSPQELKPDRRSENLTRFFERFKCPDVNYQLISDYLASADKYKIDYRLLPAISLQESTCLKHYPVDSRNPFGWASARTGFTSLQSGIDFVSRQLGEGCYYAGKTLDQKLKAYNPNPEYAPKIKGFMKDIE